MCPSIVGAQVDDVPVQGRLAGFDDFKEIGRRHLDIDVAILKGAQYIENVLLKDGLVFGLIHFFLLLPLRRLEKASADNDATPGKKAIADWPGAGRLAPAISRLRPLPPI